MGCIPVLLVAEGGQGHYRALRSRVEGQWKDGLPAGTG